MIQEKQQSEFGSFLIFASFLVGLAWLGFVAAMLGIFYSWIFGVYILAGLVTFAFISISRKRSFQKISREFILVFCIAALAALLFSHYSTPSIFSGRDQGSISEAAIRLAQNHRLEFSTPASVEFFSLHESGKAENFPGFHYTNAGKLITQFPIPYIAWLAIFYSFFGLSGLIAANAILFVLFMLSAYFLARAFFTKIWALLFVLLIATSFTFSWFFKMTLSENLAWALLWLGIAGLVYFFDTKKIPWLLATFSSFLLLAFSRIEGWFFLAIFAAIVLGEKDSRKKILRLGWKLWAALLVASIVFFANLAVNFPFFKEIGKILLKKTTFAAETGNFPELISIFLSYGIIQYLLFGICGIFLLFRQKKYSELLPLLVILPTFFYLINPNITLDHPWMLRRYSFSVLPALIFYSLFAVNYIFKRVGKITASLAIALFFLLNLPAFLQYLPYSENNGLLEQAQDFSGKFSSQDLILIDRMASGSPYAMISNPMNFLFGKNAVYFFNPPDALKIDASKFQKIYLITPFPEKYPTLSSRLKKTGEYPLASFFLENGKNSSVLPLARKVETKNMIFELAAE